MQDTNPEAERVLIDIIRQKSIPERLTYMEDLTSLVIRLSKRAIARNNPGKNKREVDLLFVKLHYGEELFDKLSQYLKETSNEEE